MASRNWIGSAKPVADVWTLTPGGTIEAGDIFIITVGQKSVSVSATNTTVAITCDDIIAAIAALDTSLYPEFFEYTWADATTAVTATGVTAGIPGTISVSTTESNGGAADAQTFVATHTTTGTGPNNWDNASNWAEGSVPVDTDDVIVMNSAISILYGLAQSSIQPTTLTIDSTFTGEIGLPARNANGYQEYRATYLAIGPVAMTIGQGNGAGSGRIKIDLGTDPCAIAVYKSAPTKEPGLEAILLKGTSASNSLTITEGSVGVAVLSGETANLSGGLKIGYETNQASDAKVRCGSGVTVATIVQTGGELEINSNATTVVRTGGTMVHRGASTLTTLHNQGGEFIDESSGTYTTVNNYATFDRRRAVSTQTITNFNAYPGSKTYTPSGSGAPAYGVTFTNAVQFHGCEPGDDVGTVWKVGLHKKFTWADI